MPGCGCLKKTSSALTSGRRNDNSCKADCLFRDEPADVVELTGGAEEHVFIGDELGVFVHEDLPDRAQVEVFRVIAEVFAMDAGPDEAAVGIDIDFGDAELRGGEELGRVDAFRAEEFTAGGVDPFDFVLRDGRRPVHDEREAGDALLNFGEDVEMERL